MSWATNYYRGQLDQQGKEAYDHIYAAWQKLQSNLVVQGKRLDPAKVASATEAVAFDHPELFWVDYYSYSQVISRTSGAHTCVSTSLKYRNFFSSHEIGQWTREVREWALGVVAQLSRRYGSDVWAWQLYDYLARQVRYGERETCYSHTIIGPLSRDNHTAVCEGIAKCYKFLCDVAGVPCIVVAGEVDLGPDDQGPHAWNIIGYGSAYRHVDVTATLHRVKREGIAELGDVFAKEDECMREYRWDRSLLPRCR